MNIDEFLLRYFTFKADKTISFEDKLVNDSDFLDTSTKSDLEMILRTDNSEPHEIFNSSCHVTAPLGSGKTYSILKLAHIKRIPLVMCVPLTPLGDQKKNEFKNEGIEILFVHGGSVDTGVQRTNDDEISNFVNNESNFVILCVYDSLHRLVNNPTFKNRAKEFVLVIDESHNLITQANFRYPAIYSVQKYSKHFAKVIYLTATPEMTRLPNDQSPIITFEKAAPIHPDASITIVSYKKKYEKEGTKLKLVNHKDTIFLISSLLYTGRDTNKRTILVWDSKKNLEGVAKGLRVYGIEKNEIFIINADEKQSANYLHLLEYERLPEGKKFILSTRLISDGVNVKDEDVQSIYFVDVNDVFMKRQFIGRFRRATPNIYDFITIDNQLNKPVGTLYENETSRITADQVICDRLNALQADQNRRSEYGRNSCKYNINDPNEAIAYTSERGFFVRSQLHRFYTLQAASNFINSSHKNLKKYYEFIGYQNISILNHTALLKQITEHSSLKISAFNKRRSLIDSVNLKNETEFHRDFDKLLTVYIDELGSNKLFSHISATFLVRNISDDFRKHNLSLLRTFDEVFSHIIDLMNLGFGYHFIKDYSKIYFSKDASLETSIDEFKQMLLFYLEYCCLVKFTNFKLIVDNYDSNDLKKKRAMLEIANIPTGEYELSELKQTVKRILNRNNYTFKETTIQYLIGSIFDITYPNRQRNRGQIAVINGLRIVYDPSDIIKRIKLFEKFSDFTKHMLVNNWERMLNYAGYFHFNRIRQELSFTGFHEQFESEYSTYIDEFHKALVDIRKL